MVICNYITIGRNDKSRSGATLFRIFPGSGLLDLFYYTNVHYSLGSAFYDAGHGR